METEFSFGRNSLAVFADNVTKSYKDGDPTLHDLTMKVETGTVYGLLGSSGCGKTTLLSCILGLKKWNSGRITVQGVAHDALTNITNMSSDQSTKVGYMPQECALQEYLTPGEVFMCYGLLYGMTLPSIVERWKELSKLLDIFPLQFQSIKSLSGGQKRRVSLAVALIHKPRLIILDEPTVGLDPLLRVRIWAYLHHLTKSAGATVLVTTHYVEELRKAHMIGVMRNGKIIVEQNPSSLMTTFETPFLQEAILKVCRINESSTRASISGSINLQNGRGDISANQIDLIHHSVQVKNCHSGTAKFESCLITPISSRDEDFTHKMSFFQSLLRFFAFVFFLEFRILRDYRLLGAILILPIFQLSTSLSLIGSEPVLLPFGVVNKEHLNWTEECTRSNLNASLQSASCYFIEELSKTTVINPIEFTNRETAELAVSQGNIWGFLEIPEILTEKMTERAAFGIFADEETINGTVIRVGMDYSNSVVSYSVLKSISNAFFAFIKILSEKNAFQQDLSFPLKESPAVYGNSETTLTAYAGAVLVILLPLQITLGLMPWLLLDERDRYIIHRVSLTGFGSIQFMAALSLAILPYGLLTSVIIYWALKYLFNIQMYGSIVAFLFQGLLSSLTGLGCGVCIAVLVGDMMSCVIVVMTLMPIESMLMGLVRPTEFLPTLVRTLSIWLVPIVPLTDSVRSTMNRGLSIIHPTSWPGVVITLGWIFISFGVSIAVRRKLTN